jgi:hypothetical protein
VLEGSELAQHFLFLLGKLLQSLLVLVVPEVPMEEIQHFLPLHLMVVEAVAVAAIT